MNDVVLVNLAALIAVVVTMLLELWVSKRHERALVTSGAVAPADPVYSTMQWAYPSVFLVMIAEGTIGHREPGRMAAVGALVWVLAKIFKYWAISTLGHRWTYRVLVLPAAPLVTTGPYRLMRHPNYVGVIGELVGIALLTNARWTGPVATVFFGWLLHLRIRAEERALRLN